MNLKDVLSSMCDFNSPEGGSMYYLSSQFSFFLRMTRIKSKIYSETFEYTWILFQSKEKHSETTGGKLNIYSL